MVGIITQSTTLNSFWSISFCVLALGLHGYATYLAAQRYREALGRAWPGPAFKGGTPGEVATHLALLVLSCLLLPFFAVASFLRVGNYGNDGVKLGRDHALNPNLDAWCRKVRNPVVRRLWTNCVPLAQTVFLAAAFLLLLPETLLTAVEVDYGYKTSDAVWSSDVDFLFGEDRPHTSDVMASINLTNTVANGSRVLVPTVRPPPGGGGWGADHSVSLAFVNFALGLLTFSVRYASVFWYTNKALTVVFALQLLAMSLTGLLGYSAFGCQYKVCRNHRLYINVDLSLGCGVSLALYFLGSAVMLLSTMIVFEYGSHYFAEKLRIVERKHRSHHQQEENYVKKTIVVNSGCQGYVPHSCAMAALVGLAVCKGPLMYDLVNLYRPTRDGLVLTGLVAEVCYMILWIALWFGLTIKQRWQFRILDYVPLGKPLFMIHDDQVMKNPTFDRSSGNGDGGGGHSLEMQDVGVGVGGSRSGGRRGHNRDSPPGYLEALSNGYGEVTPDHDVAHSEAGTEESDPTNPGDMDCLSSLPHGGGARRKVRPGGRRHGGQRVTFDDSVHSTDRRASGGDYGGTGDTGGGGQSAPPRHLNVKVDVHDNMKTSHPAAASAMGYHGDGSSSGDASAAGSGGVKMRRQNGKGDNTLTREYRNSIRSKCDDLYAVVDHSQQKSNSLNNLSRDVEGAAAPPSTAVAADPLPTLMSSFRDKLKESSRTASTYREQRRNMQLGQYGSLERDPGADSPTHTTTTTTAPATVMINGIGGGSSSTDLDRPDGDRRRPAVDADLGDITLRLDDSLDSGVRSSKQGSTVSGSDDDHHHHHDHHNHSFQHAHHHHNNNSPHQGSQYYTPKPPGSLANSTFESESGSSLPSIRENGQLSVVPPCSVSSSSPSDKPPRQLGKMDYLSIDKAGHVYSRHLNVVPRTKAEIGRRDSANYSLTSSQETSSNDSDHGQGLCSQNANASKPK
ncbi:uncharacterized protein LOC143293762 [Babylonia areolata]|uniref:uncharacterized protein LOC143293762 n=1 Tax=Babylonia areolata TaxID=304850 RepID=UPI003FD4EE5C